MNLIDFLNLLSDNNNRPWFQQHKAIYDDLRARWIDDLDRLIAALSAREPELTYVAGADCAYRIYRDTRFSPDKTPYKTYFSAQVSPHGRRTDEAAYYIHASIAPGDSGLYGGIWSPDAAKLRILRRAITDNIEEFREIISAPAMLKAYPQWCGRRLKTVPKGWPKNHPDADLLALCDIGRFHAVTSTFFLDPSWPDKAADTLHLLQPLNRFINYSLHESDQ